MLFEVLVTAQGYFSSFELSFKQHTTNYCGVLHFYLKKV